MDILRFWLFCQESSENIDISLIPLGSIQRLQMSFEGETGSLGFSNVNVIYLKSKRDTVKGANT